MSGRLTAEQVRECVEDLYWEGYNDGYVHRGYGIEETDWQAIADKLNSRAKRTCHIVKNSRKYVLSDGRELFDDGCSICNGYIGDGDNYCSNCGAKVVS